jgi:WD40 repeat protein
MTKRFNTKHALFFSPDNTKLVTISKDRRAIVWDVKKGKKHAEMGWDTPNGVVYTYKRIR